MKLIYSFLFMVFLLTSCASESVKMYECDCKIKKIKKYSPSSQQSDQDEIDLASL